MNATAPVAILFALPEESREFCACVQVEKRSGSGVDLRVHGLLGAAPVVVAHTGVGAVRAAARARAIVREETPAALISAGFAGGLHPSAALGRVVVDAPGWAGQIPAACLAGRIVSAPRVVEGAAEKAALGHRTGALAVDMETAAIAAVAAEAGLPMAAVRTISDPVESDLPVPMAIWFDAERQRPRPFSLVWYLLRHPARIPPFARFVRGLAPARQALAQALSEFVQGAERTAR